MFLSGLRSKSKKESMQNIIQHQYEQYYNVTSYHIIQNVRAILVAFFVVVLTHHILGVLITLTILNVVMALYYLFMSPFKHTIANIHQIIFEMLTAVITATFMFLSSTFSEITKYEVIPEDKIREIDRLVLIVLACLYLLIANYVVCFFVASIPTLQKRFAAKPKQQAQDPGPPPKPFDPNAGMKIPLRGLVQVDHAKVYEQHVEMRENAGHNVGNEYRNAGVEIVQESPDEKAQRLRRREEEARRKEEEDKYVEKYIRNGFMG